MSRVGWGRDGRGAADREIPADCRKESLEGLGWAEDDGGEDRLAHGLWVMQLVSDSESVARGARMQMEATGLGRLWVRGVGEHVLKSVLGVFADGLGAMESRCRLRQRREVEGRGLS